jgi:hypothetical protein
VQAQARRLLSRLPGSNREHPALHECLERIQQTQTGVVRKKIALTLDVPANRKENTVRFWIREMFAEVSFDELARGLGMTEHEVVAAASKDLNLLLGLAVVATQDGCVDLLAKVVGALPDAWEQMALSGSLELAHLHEDKRMRWAEALTRPMWSKPPQTYVLWSWLHRAVRGPVPAALMEAVLKPGWFAEQQDSGELDGEWLELLAACCPPGQRESMRKLFETMDPTLTINAMSLIEILAAMETDNHE